MNEQREERKTLRWAKKIVKRAVYSRYFGELALRWRVGTPIILMYHGVTANTPQGLQNFEGKHVGVARFGEQLQLLRRHRRIIPLTELVDGIVNGTDMSNTVAITFDDGYENNQRHAARLLADLRIPATFYLATGYIGTDRWLWVDRLEVALDRSHRSTIELDGLGLVVLNDKRAALSAIKKFAKLQPEEAVERLVIDVERQCGVEAALPYGDYRFMSWDQVRQLKSSGFEIGAHTVNHPILSRVSYDRGAGEILDSRDRIRSELGACSDVFCYPNGKACDYTPEIMDFIAHHFRAALSTNRGPARSSERYELRRLGVSSSTTAVDLVGLLLREK